MHITSKPISQVYKIIQCALGLEQPGLSSSICLKVLRSQIQTGKRVCNFDESIILPRDKFSYRDADASKNPLAQELWNLKLDTVISLSL